MKIKFEGAAQTVTGSLTQVSYRGFSFIVDCGLYQAPKPMRLLNWTKPPFFNETKAIILTHAHIDHSGLLPRWAQWGWKGPVYCTPSTAELLSVLLLDAAKLQEEDAKFANFSRYSKHDPALPLYTTKDAEDAIKLLHPIPFDQWNELSPFISFRLLRAGHILGSSFIQISYTDGEKSQLLTFSGDLGGGHSDLIKEPNGGIETDCLILESTYGDRVVNSKGRNERLADVINSVFNRNGTLIIPAFALGRTQDLLFAIHHLMENGKIPSIPVYLDSPMAKKVTKIYQKYLDELKFDSSNNEIQKSLSSKFFQEVEGTDDSMLLCMSDEPKIVLSASGMLQGGRVLHHLKQKLPNEKNGVLFVGFQGHGTKGRLLQEKLSTIRIHHQEVSVEAEIFSIEGFSAHGDSEDLIRWIKSFIRPPNKIFLNHGEPESQLVFSEKLKQEFTSEIYIPALHSEFEL